MNRVTMLIMGMAIFLASLPPARAVDDQTIRRLIKKAGNAKKHNKAPAILVFERTRTEVVDSGLAHVNIHTVTKILTRKGVARFATVRFDYDPMSSFVKLKKMRIFRKDGKVQDIPASAVYDLPQPQKWIYWGARMKVVDLPRLQVGDAVEFKFYRKGFIIAYLGQGAGAAGDEKYIPPMQGHFYDVVYFTDNLPIMEKRYTLIIPRNKPIRYQVYNGSLSSSLNYNKTHFTYTWWKKGLKALKKEPKMSAYSGWLMDYSDSIPKLVLATVPDWPTKSRWFYKLHEKRKIFMADKAIKKKVKALLKGKKSMADKVRALTHWVANNIRYSGVSMGKGEGYTIHPATMIFNDRSGVCKDKAGMLIAMLRVAGFTAYGALTQAGSRVEQVPADQFNHCVVALKKEDGSYWMLDPTWVPFSKELWSSAEQRQNYVIGSPQGEKLMATPYVPPKNNYIRITAKSKIDRKGNLKSTVMIKADGYADARLRWQFIDRLRQYWRRNAEKIVGNVSSGAVLRRFKLYNLRDQTRSFAIRLEYSVPRYAAADDKVLSFTMPLARHLLKHLKRLSDYLSIEKTKKRKYQTFLKCTWDVAFDETLDVPGGYKLLWKPKTVKMDGKVAAFESRVEMAGSKLRFAERLLVKNRNFGPELYPGFQKAVLAMKKLMRHRVLLKKED